MAWNLQLPRVHFLSGTTSIEIKLETRIRCSVSEERQETAKTAQESLLSFSIFPSEAALPINIDGLACTDAYIRESDLIAIYDQRYPWPFGYQVDFRFRSDLEGGLRAMELWMSISTSMLDCHPKLHLIPETRLLQSASPEIAIAAHGRAALIVHPLDFSDCEPVPASEFDGLGHWDVFGSFMEKGVIRRARFLCAWSDAIQPTNTWKQLLEEFSRSPLPLTA